MNDQQLTETFLSSELKFAGKLINVEHWKVRLPNGDTALREVARHCGAVAVVPLHADGTVTLVRQHRIAVGKLTWEVPAGKLDHGAAEDHAEAARRELEEETGLTADTLREMTTIETTPGFCDERITLYLATGLHQRQSHPDEDEFVTARRFPLPQAVKMILQGEITDGKTICALLMAEKACSALPA